jgi:hypothetical protein
VSQWRTFLPLKKPASAVLTSTLCSQPVACMTHGPRCTYHSQKALALHEGSA